ncbi:MAG: NAD-dependent epimerase/dehydratase family protein [Eggerthellaceae bacterium]|nr:NAD-dependent epimerase/dehydratase family protein [Eggerthellaceae bacterium]
MRYSIDHPDAYIESNIVGFFNILEACRHYPVEHLVYASSSSVYGNNAQAPFSTDAKTDEPISLYAATKKSDELFAHAYSALYSTPTTSLRFFTVYGPYGRPDMFVYSATEKLLAGKPIQLYGGGLCRRDFTNIDDIVEGVGIVSNSVSYAHYFEGSFNRVEEIDRQLVTEGEDDHAPVKDPEPLVFTEDIRLENIRYAYPTGDKPVLDGANMTIPRNKSVGIVGSSGAGKTTLVDVMLGLLEAQSGTMRIDGEKVDPTCRSWQRLFAYIPENVFMLTGSIFDNVVFGQVEPCDNVNVRERVWAALETAQLADFVQTLERGFDTEIGEAGVRLSGGQIQRLGIARALFSDAPILVLDEATSALDYDAEEALMEVVTNLRGKRR